MLTTCTSNMSCLIFKCSTNLGLNLPCNCSLKRDHLTILLFLAQCIGRCKAGLKTADRKFEVINTFMAAACQNICGSICISIYTYILDIYSNHSLAT